MATAKSHPPGGEEAMPGIGQAARLASLSRACMAKLIDSRVVASQPTADGERLVSQNAALGRQAGVREREPERLALAMRRLGADLDREIFPS